MPYSDFGAAHIRPGRHSLFCAFVFQLVQTVCAHPFLALCAVPFLAKNVVGHIPFLWPHPIFVAIFCCAKQHTLLILYTSRPSTHIRFGHRHHISHPQSGLRGLCQLYTPQISNIHLQSSTNPRWAPKKLDLKWFVVFFIKIFSFFPQILPTCTANIIAKLSKLGFKKFINKLLLFPQKHVFLHKFYGLLQYVNAFTNSLYYIHIQASPNLEENLQHFMYDFSAHK